MVEPTSASERVNFASWCFNDFEQDAEMLPARRDVAHQPSILASPTAAPPIDRVVTEVKDLRDRPIRPIHVPGFNKSRQRRAAHRRRRRKRAGRSAVTRRVRRMAYVVVGTAVNDHLIRPNDHRAPVKLAPSIRQQWRRSRLPPMIATRPTQNSQKRCGSLADGTLAAIQNAANAARS